MTPVGASSFLRGVMNNEMNKIHFDQNLVRASSAYVVGLLLSSHAMVLELDLSECALGDEGIENLAHGLAINHSVRELLLCKNKIGDYGARLLSECFASNSTLVHVDLSRNCIWPKGGIALSQAFRENCNIKKLSLKTNYLDDAFATDLLESLSFNGIVQQIILDFNTISVKLLIQINQVLSMNKMNFERKVIPDIEENISRIRLSTTSMGNVHSLLETKRQEELKIKKVLSKQIRRYHYRKQQEQKKTTKLQITYEELNSTHCKLSTKLASIQLKEKEATMGYNKLLLGYGGHIMHTAASIKTLEKDSNFQSEELLVEHYNLQRIRFESDLEDLNATVTQATEAYDAAQSRLNTFRLFLLQRQQNP